MERFQNARGEIWLNVASSFGALEEFVNLDNHIFMRRFWSVPPVPALLPSKYRGMIDAYRKARSSTILLGHDCRKRLPFPDASVDHVLCSHFLEHVHPVEMERIVRDFRRVLRSGATVHLVLPDLALQVSEYVERKRAGDAAAADDFVRRTLLSREARGRLRYRLLEFTGAFGLQHRWMYDRESLAARVAALGFELLSENRTPSRDYRRDDGESLHVVGRKIA
jgi:predicted SAM-dependent methyltransferase